MLERFSFFFFPISYSTCFVTYPDLLIRIEWFSIFVVFPCRVGPWVLAHRPLTGQWHLFLLRTLLAKRSDVAHFLCSCMTEVVSGHCFISRYPEQIVLWWAEVTDSLIWSLTSPPMYSTYPRRLHVRWECGCRVDVQMFLLPVLD